MNWKSLDLTIDASTGLASARRDIAGAATVLEYDGMNRLTAEKPQSFLGVAPDAWTRITYVIADPNFKNGFYAETHRCSEANQLTCTDPSNNLPAERIELDEFGRTFLEFRQYPDVTPSGNRYAVRASRFDPQGRKRRVTSWLELSTDPNFEAAPATVLSDYDRFGRPGTITLADGSATSFLYEGIQWTKTEQQVATSISGVEGCVGKWERFDRHGRLARLEEGYQSATCEGPVGSNTEYGYDEGGRLKRVCQNGTLDSCTQERLFNYDNRGFLTSETHPEKGASGHGTVSYSCYDSRGNARYRDDGAASRRLGFTHDAADRLLSVKATTNSSCTSASITGTEWKSFTYAEANSGTDAKLGKLETAARRNELGAPSFPANTVATVAETHAYSERGGRLSSRTTAVSGAGVTSETWSTSATYNSLGLTSSIMYPTCVAGSRCAAASTPWYVVLHYDDGLLERIDEGGAYPVWLYNVLYHPSGMPATITHGALTETITQASHGMARPNSITISMPGELLPFQSGTYLYDGAGNIKSIGTDKYRYDRYHRLVEAQMNSISPARTQSYTMDSYGNITTVTTTGGTTDSFSVIGTTTNRIKPLLFPATYDEGGNLTSWTDATTTASYSWDPLNMLKRWSNSGMNGEGWSYVYTASDERLWSIKDGTDDSYSNWTIRGFGNEVLSRVERRRASFMGVVSTDSPDGEIDSPAPLVEPRAGVHDYLYRNGELFATRRATSAGDRHFGLDHLGTVRVIDLLGGGFDSRHTYFPFGREATSTSQDTEVMKFAGHERDLQADPANTVADLDYMHARFFSPITARFLSVDRGSVRPSKPQSWNRYAYAIGNPIKYVDPDGNEIGAAYDAWDAQLSSGALSMDEHEARTAASAQANAVGAAGAVVMAGAFTPGPEDIVLGLAARSGGILSRLGGSIAKLVTRGSDAARGGNQAFNLAAAGGRHAGTLGNYASRSTSEIASGVRSYQSNVAEHIDKIANPAKYAKEWGSMTTQQQQGLINKWRKDLKRNEELRDVLQGLLDSRNR